MFTYMYLYKCHEKLHLLVVQATHTNTVAWGCLFASIAAGACVRLCVYVRVCVMRADSS